MKSQQKRKGRQSPTGDWQTMNRKQRREMARRIQAEDLSLEVVHPDAAGIDIGNGSHYVAVPSSRDCEPVQRFGCTTAELRGMAAWLKQCGIRTVAMQLTGVYWILVYDILEEAGLEVYLVNACETKNLPGRKSDVQESQWLMKLHTYGLLRNSFRPAQEIRMLRTYWRQRNDLVQSAGWHIQRIQKALTQMNVQGERAERCERGNGASDYQGHSDRRARSPPAGRVSRPAGEGERGRDRPGLEGNWQADLLFVLKQEQEGYEFLQKQIAACDGQLEQYLQERPDRSAGPVCRKRSGGGGCRRGRISPSSICVRSCFT